MSAKEPNDPFDLSQMPDLENLDPGRPSNKADMDLPDLEPFTEASAENLPELPELPDQVELKPKRVSSTPPIDDLPALPSDALTASAKPASAPKPVAKAPAPKPAAPPVAKPIAASKPAPVKPIAPKVTAPKATAPKTPAPKAAAPKPTPVVQKPVVQKVKPVQKPIKKVAPKPAPAAAAEAPKETPEKSSAVVEPVKASIEPTTPTTTTPTPDTANTGATTPAAPEPAGERQPDLAPIHLRKASWIVLLGSLLPWMGSGAGWVTFVAAKLTICLGAWILFQTVRHGAKETVPGVISKLAAIRWAKPDSGKRNKPMSEQLLGTVPSLGHLLGLVALLGGVAVTLFDPAYDKASGSLLKGLAEVGMLAWAAGTMVHIFAFTHGGKFNPIFPLMYLGGAIGGLGAIVRDIAPAAEKLEPNYIAAVGAAGVCAGGFMAMWTMWLAMKEAKEQGERKKAAQIEARKAAREARKK